MVVVVVLVCHFTRRERAAASAAIPTVCEGGEKTVGRVLFRRDRWMVFRMVLHIMGLLCCGGQVGMGGVCMFRVLLMGRMG